MLKRQSSISQELVYNMMFIDDSKKQEITNCLISNNEYANINHTHTGIYWNNQVNNYHMSFHPGGSLSEQGAMHIKYDVRYNYNRLRTINFPIHVYDKEYRNRRLTQNVLRFGQDIEIDINELYSTLNQRSISIQERQDILYLLGKIGECLFQGLTFYLDKREKDMTLHGRYYDGGRKGKTRRKREKRKKRTIKNKVNIKR